ncbi:hypothetical protein QTP88_013302 [Uroleucon formosanum]
MRWLHASVAVGTPSSAFFVDISARTGRRASGENVAPSPLTLPPASLGDTDQTPQTRAPYPPRGGDRGTPKPRFLDQNRRKQKVADNTSRTGFGPRRHYVRPPRPHGGELIRPNTRADQRPVNAEPIRGVRHGHRCSESTSRQESEGGGTSHRQSRASAGIPRLRPGHRPKGEAARHRAPEAPLIRRPPDTEADTGAEMVTEDESAMDIDAIGSWADVVGKKRRRRVAAPVSSTARPKVPITSVANKSPAILIRPGAGKSFADTVRSVRSSGLNAQDMDASVKMRETRNGALLLELPKGAKSSTAAKSLATALSSKLGDSVGKVSPLGVQVEIEVLDLDAVS